MVTEDDAVLVPGNGFEFQSLINIITFERLLKSGKHYEDALALYCFYARLVQTRGRRSIWATVAFCAQGLGFGEDRVRRARKTLLDLGLIEDEQIRGDNGIEKWVVHIHYVPKKEPTQAPERATLGESPTLPPTLGDSPTPNKDFELEVDLNSRSRSKLESRARVVPNPLPWAELLPKEHVQSRSFRKAWLEWNTYRKETHRKPMPETTIRRQVALLAKYPPSVATQMINKSIFMQWAGLFPLDEKDQHPALAQPKDSGSPPILAHEKTLRAMNQWVEIHPQDKPALDARLTEVLARMNRLRLLGQSRFIDLFEAWLDDKKHRGNGSWLRGIPLKPGHLDPDGKTMREFYQWVYWTNGNDDRLAL